MSKGKEFVDATIKDGKVVVFSKSFCPYCKKTKALLNDKNLKDGSLVVIDIDQRDDMEAIQAHLLELTGKKSVPRNFIGGQSIGGNDDIHALETDGKLETLLKEVGAL